MLLKLYCKKVNTWKNSLYFKKGAKNNLLGATYFTIFGSILMWVFYGWNLFKSTQHEHLAFSYRVLRSFLACLFIMPKSGQHLVPPIFVLVMTGIIMAAIFFILYGLFLFLPPLLIRKELLERLLLAKDSKQSLGSTHEP